MQRGMDMGMRLGMMGMGYPPYGMGLGHGMGQQAQPHWFDQESLISDAPQTTNYSSTATPDATTRVTPVQTSPQQPGDLFQQQPTDAGVVGAARVRRATGTGGQFIPQRKFPGRHG
jgi:hypothetical protein